MSLTRRKLFENKEDKKHIGVFVSKSFDTKIVLAAMSLDMSKGDFLRSAIQNAIINGLPDDLPKIDGILY